MAQIFKIAANEYQKLPDDMKLRFRLLIVDTNKQGQVKTMLDNEIVPVDVDLSQMDAGDRQRLLQDQIHPGRLRLPTLEAADLVAQVATIFCV
jgi:hypothetical protein